MLVTTRLEEDTRLVDGEWKTSYGYGTRAEAQHVASSIEGPDGAKDIVVLGPPSGAHRDPRVTVGPPPAYDEFLARQGRNGRLSFLAFYARATEAAARRFMEEFSRAPGRGAASH